jgi:hypothetical protein
MSNIEEIERAVEKLPIQDFVRLAAWVDQRRQQLEARTADLRFNGPRLLSSS